MLYQCAWGDIFDVRELHNAARALVLCEDDANLIKFMDKIINLTAAK